MLPADLEQVIEQDHDALAAFVTGDPERKKRLYSRADDATLANPYGPPVRGWNQVAAALERAAAQPSWNTSASWPENPPAGLPSRMTSGTTH
jgi:hypothetical protein